MANNNKHKDLNVPNLRFPEFSGEWRRTSLKDISTVNPKSASLEESFVYIDLEAVEKGILKKQQTILRSEAPSRAQRVIMDGDILFQCVRPYQKNNYLHKGQNNDKTQWVASTGYAQIRTTESPSYLYHILNTDGFNKKVMVRCTGSSYPAINSDDLSTIHFYFSPQKEEQRKISQLFDLLDERIATQKKIIEDFKKLKSIIRSRLFSEMEYRAENYVEIRDVLSYEQPAQYIVNSTEYSDEYSTPVLTANKAFVLGYTDETDGVYNKGECIIFDDFTMDVKYVSFPFKVKSSAIKILTPKRGIDLYFMYEYLQYLNLVSEEHKRHYISDIEPMNIVSLTFKQQIAISRILHTIDQQVDNENRILTLYIKHKQHFLAQMLI